MKNLLLSFIALLFASGVGAQAPGTVKSATRIGAKAGSLGVSPNWVQLGFAMCSYPDRDGNGIKELVFQASDNANSVRGIYILGLNTNGTLKPNPILISAASSILSTVPTKYPGFNANLIGGALTSIKDLNGNGIDELVATGGMSGGPVFILFMNVAFGVDSFTMIYNGYSGFSGTSTMQDGFGISVANIGDIDKDGIEDLAIGSVRDNINRGGVYIVFMKSNGTVKGSKYISDNTNGFGPLGQYSLFGLGIAGMGDLDKDGVPDIMVSSQTTSNDARGELWTIFLKADGSVKNFKLLQPAPGSKLDTINTNSYFGSAIARVGDLDGDKVADVATSAWNYTDSLNATYGRVYILLMNQDGTLKGTQIIDRFHGNLQLPLDVQGRFGYTVVAMDDVNGDRIFDLAVGAPFSKEPGTTGNSTGAMYLLKLNGIPIATGVGDQIHNLTESYFLYPNPTSDYIRIRSRKPLATALQVRLLDGAGRTVKEASGEGSETLEIEVAHLPAGLYHIIMESGKEVQQGKFIKK